MYGGVDDIQLFVTIVGVFDSHRIKTQFPFNLILLRSFNFRVGIDYAGYCHFLIYVEEGFSFCSIGDVVSDEEAGISLLLSLIPEFLHVVDKDGCL